MSCWGWAGSAAGPGGGSAKPRRSEAEKKEKERPPWVSKHDDAPKIFKSDRYRYCTVEQSFHKKVVANHGFIFFLGWGVPEKVGRFFRFFPFFFRFLSFVVVLLFQSFCCACGSVRCVSWWIHVLCYARRDGDPQDIKISMTLSEFLAHPKHRG